ncbi:MAG: sigma 54-interacting transcriptional regulator [Candidatus Krumholzibacteriota bacterium]|nr:sigma 54-interacting transcriptional regulator [Candidatus Krumholzibacteriota bacterium]
MSPAEPAILVENSGAGTEILDASRAVLSLLARRVPGSRWDLLHWERTGQPRFLLGKLADPHPGLARLDETRQAPPVLLAVRAGDADGRQLSLYVPHAAPPAPRADFVWPLGGRGEAPWIYGRLAMRDAEALAARPAWLGLLFAELAAPWSRAARPAAPREVQGILHHESSPLVELLEQLARVARTETPVFLQGESGVGKELFARALHRLSPRADSPFVAQNGGALPDTLIESELFGHSRGSFTGAREERVGLVELAHGGTFFLDEVGDLSPMLQVRLLRVIQDRQIRRVGDNRLRPVDFRLVTATHRDMEEMVRAGRFRLDLWYRIQGVRLRIPPLRERPLDLPILARAFLAERAAACGLPMRAISADALALMQRYAWPGNVRELQNEIGRVVAFYGELPRLERWMLSASLYEETDDALPSALAGLTLQEAQEDLERRMIRQVLARFQGNRSRSARALGLSRQGLLKKLKRLGLERVALKPGA